MLTWTGLMGLIESALNEREDADNIVAAFLGAPTSANQNAIVKMVAGLDVVRETLQGYQLEDYLIHDAVSDVLIQRARDMQERINYDRLVDALKATVAADAPQLLQALRVAVANNKSAEAIINAISSLESVRALRSEHGRNMTDTYWDVQVFMALNDSVGNGE